MYDGVSLVSNLNVRLFFSSPFFLAVLFEHPQIGDKYFEAVY